MNPETAVALVALAWLAGAWIVMVRLIRRGRHLAETLAQRHPETYEALGRPRPGYLDTLQRDRFARFVAQREFQALADPVLAERFEAHRRSEARSVILILASLLAVGILVLVVRYAP